MNHPQRLQFTSALNICRVLNGLWQVSGAHGGINPRQAVESMFKYVDAGLKTWDLADYQRMGDCGNEYRRSCLLPILGTNFFAGSQQKQAFPFLQCAQVTPLTKKLYV